MSAPVQGPGFKVCLRTISGRNLAAKDRNGLSDPFLKIKFGDQKYTTQVCPKTLDPKWNDQIEFPVPIHQPPKQLIINCWDKDRFGRDFMGTFQVPLENLFTREGRPVLFERTTPEWYPLEARGGEEVSGDIELQWGFLCTEHDLTRHLDWCTLLESLVGRKKALEMIELQKKSDAENSKIKIPGFSTGSGLVSSIIAEASKKKEQVQNFASRFMQHTDTIKEKKKAEKTTSREIAPATAETTVLATTDSSDTGAVPSPSTEEIIDNTALSVALYGTNEHHGYFFSGVAKAATDAQEDDAKASGASEKPKVIAAMNAPTPAAPQLSQQQQQRLLSLPESYMHYSASPDVKPLVTIAREVAEAAGVEPDPDTSANEIVIATVTATSHTVAEHAAAEAKEGKLPVVGDTFLPGGPPSRAMSLPVSGPEVLGVLFMDICSASNLPALKNFLRTGFDMDPFVVITFGRHTFRTQAIRHSLNPSWNERLYFHLSRHELVYPINFTVVDQDKFSSNDRVAITTVPLTELLKAFDMSPEQMKDMDAVPDADNIEAQAFALKMQPANEGEWEGDCVLHIKVRFIPYAALRRCFWCALSQQYDSDGNGRMNRFEITTMLDSLGSTLTADTIDQFFRRHNLDPVEDELTFSQLASDLERHLSTQHGPTHKNTNQDTSPNEGESRDVDDIPEHHLLDIQKQASRYEVEELGEQVIRIDECPICHKPGLAGGNDTDILTHVAICTLNDPDKVDRFMMGNFVSEAQAQRRWFTKVASYVSYGSYNIGKNNAVILVQDRKTGQLVEEKMATYVRLGIRLLYQSIGSKRTVDSKTIRNLFQSLSFKQGKKFNNPDSVRDIEPFIKFHKLNVDEILDPLDSFANFNEFFYRKLKPDARAIAAPNDKSVAVSPADARILCFPTIKQATEIWIKGIGFTIERLLGDADLARSYEGGSLCIFRLAPQDYHRFHVPVDGVFSEPKPIEGSYYTVNPMAIRSSLDVYGENKRIVSTIESERFGRVAYVCVGAMMVGSIVLTAEPGKHVARGDEYGYFAFGGSTIVALFEPGKIQLDADLVENASKPLETLVQMGESIGYATS